MPLPQVPRVIRESVAYDARYQKRVFSISEAQLVNAAAGGVFDVPLFFLPPAAVLLKPPAVKLNVQFTGGGAHSLSALTTGLLDLAIFFCAAPDAKWA